jgi:hypothetical protein
MGLLRNICLVFLAAAAFGAWRVHVARVAAVQAAYDAEKPPSAQGFVPMPAIADRSSRVLILAAMNCPREAARRADALVGLLSEQGVPSKRSAGLEFRFTSRPTQEEVDRMNRVMTGPLPIVFVDGRAKNNPDVSEIVAEYRASPVH